MTDEPIITLKVKLDNIVQMISNKVTSWSNTPSNDNYPSEKLVKDSLDGKANLSHNHDDRYYTESEIVDFLNKKIDLDCEFIDGWWTSNNQLRGQSVKDSNTLRYDGKKFIYKVPDFSDSNSDDELLYLWLATSNSTYGVLGKLYYNGNTIYVKDAKTLFMNKYLLIEHIQNGTFSEYHILDIFNIFHNHNDVYYSKSEIDNKIITDVSGLTDNQGLLFSGSYNDLSNKPSIPTATSDLTNDSGFLTSHQDITGKEDKDNKITSLNGTLTESDTDYPSSLLVLLHLDTKEDITNKVTSINSSSTDDEYPSAKAVYDGIWTDLYGTIQNEYVQSNDLGTVAFSNDYEDLNNLPQLGNLAYENDVDLSGHDLDELSDNTNLLFSGDYDDLLNKPSIPSSSSDLSDGSSLVKTSGTIGLLKNDGTVDTTSYSTFNGSIEDTDFFSVLQCVIDNFDNFLLWDIVFNVNNYNGLPNKNCSVANNVLTNNAVSQISLNKEFTSSTNYTLEFDYYTSAGNRNGFCFGADPSLEDGSSMFNSDGGLQIVVDVGNTYVETFTGSSSPTNVYTHTSNLLTDGTHHIMIVRDGANATFYIDNVELYTYANAQYNTIGLNKWGWFSNSISNIEITIGD